MFRKLLLGDIERRLITMEVVLDSLISVLINEETITRGQIQVELLRRGLQSDDE